MKTTILLTALLSGAMMTAAAAQGAGHQNRPDFATLDLNSDGGVTMEEMQAQGQARFTAADTDGDGALSVAEMTAAAQARAGARAAQMLERLDSNGDGLLQQAEMQPRGGARLDRMFARLDADADGMISEAEFAAAQDHFGGGKGMHRGDGHGPRDRG
ncbi:EF-hand domain-containing protein [Yoonia sp.]|uniref:EF-hand domain-containing protein n=1 Tax=Yoonia sp. TaxID=2212373 RepID=UPI003F6CED6F